MPAPGFGSGGIKQGIKLGVVADFRIEQIAHEIMVDRTLVSEVPANSTAVFLGAPVYIGVAEIVIINSGYNGGLSHIRYAGRQDPSSYSSVPTSQMRT